MSNVVSLAHPPPQRAEEKACDCGVVAASDGERYFVRTASGSLTAARAPSCLLVPCVGDEVWFTFDVGGQPYIVAVLVRASDAATVALPGRDTSVTADGAVKLASGGALELGATDAVRVHGAALDVATTRTRIASEAVDLFAERMVAGVGVARLVAGRLDAALGSLATRAKRVLRWVEELEQVRAAELDLRASGNARLAGECAFVSAERLAQVRGEEIHLG
jgi:hypothetical protein